MTKKLRSNCERFLTDLVRINSVNPLLVPGAPGEREAAAYVAREMAGFAPRVLESTPGRPSVLARLAGAGGGPSLMLNGHIDTVGVGAMPNPLAAALHNGRITGRGSYDMKASVAACMAAMHALADSPPRGDVYLAAVADEEYGSLGTMEVLEHIRTDAAIVTEPSALNVCLAHKGYLWIEVETAGRAAHGSRFDLGIDANMKMGRFLAKLDSLERELRARPPHALVGPPSLHAAMLEGGTGLSTYAASCKLKIERRLIPGETAEQAIAEIASIADDARVHCFFARDAFEIAPHAAIVQAVKRAADKVRGEPARFVGDTPWMDSALCAAAGIETVVIGPAGAGAHSDDEWVDLQSAIQLAEILVEAARDFCA